MWTRDAWYGGAVATSISADAAIVDIRKRVHTYLPGSSGLKVALPDARRLQPGHALFLVVNEHASRTLVVTDSTGTTLVSLVGHQATTLSLLSAASAAGSWVGAAQDY